MSPNAMFRMQRAQQNAHLRERLVIQLASAVWQNLSETEGATRDAAWRDSVAQECIKVADALIHELDKRNKEPERAPAVRLEEVKKKIIDVHEYLGITQGRLSELQAEARRLEARIDKQP